jgi:predicted Ser/Thr protein kinase/SAM-dependent methyltransferase
MRSERLILDATAGAVSATLGLARGQSWQSPIDRSRRYAMSAEQFCKIALNDRSVAAPARRQDLQREAWILRRCRGIRGVPEFVDWLETPAMNVLIMQRVHGAPLSQVEPGWFGLFGIWLHLLGLVARLAWRGVSHDDLRPENILVAPEGEVWLVDFDQATMGSMTVCLLRSLFGIGLGRTPVSNAIAAPLRERVQASLPPSLIRFLTGRRNRRRRPRGAGLAPLPATAGPELRALHEAWRIAAGSRASSPAQAVAYYELEFGGLRFPGERAWAERWRCLGRITDYRGRRVLDLGCNLGLLSIFLLKEAGAAAALAVDGDPLILEAAGKAAEAFAVRPEFRRIDFDRDAGWEGVLEAFRPDVVFALSLLNWVEDKARLLAFLGRFEELVFEGHDSAATERRRLRAAGFTRIELVATSERGRPVLHCRKSPPA